MEICQASSPARGQELGRYRCVQWQQRWPWLEDRGREREDKTSCHHTVVNPYIHRLNWNKSLGYLKMPGDIYSETNLCPEMVA